ncbi:hypothetical protein F5X68DRAFT_237994 [Plectosphaerella plurivora]|uniref:Uncharacterized protein n=1 Tax=Plectosphaerella plurivora TaxID=936078 RepID=A0A9P8UUW3_9PEZI|nr:hypothetical protein F5X68DRAFT_237994 [Plectosphaerella plurivora]
MGWTVTFMPNGKMRVESQYYQIWRTNDAARGVDNQLSTAMPLGGRNADWAATIAVKRVRDPDSDEETLSRVEKRVKTTQGST